MDELTRHNTKTAAGVAPRAAHTWQRMQRRTVHRGMKNAIREPSWCRPYPMLLVEVASINK